MLIFAALDYYRGKGFTKLVTVPDSSLVLDWEFLTITFFLDIRPVSGIYLSQVALSLWEFEQGMPFFFPSFRKAELYSGKYGFKK